MKEQIDTDQFCFVTSGSKTMLYSVGVIGVEQSACLFFFLLFILAYLFLVMNMMTEGAFVLLKIRTEISICGVCISIYVHMASNSYSISKRRFYVINVYIYLYITNLGTMEICILMVISTVKKNGMKFNSTNNTSRRATAFCILKLWLPWLTTGSK